MKIREMLSAILLTYRVHRLEAARKRVDYLLSVTPRFWQAASIGGGTHMQLGQITESEALQFLKTSGHVIAYLDRSAAFIAVKGESQERNAE